MTQETLTDEEILTVNTGAVNTVSNADPDTSDADADGADKVADAADASIGSINHSFLPNLL